MPLLFIDIQSGSERGCACCAGLPCPNHTAIAEHMLAAVSDPMMSRCLLNHVERKGPYAGIARVRTRLHMLQCRPHTESLEALALEPLLQEHYCFELCQAAADQVVCLF